MEKRCKSVVTDLDENMNINALTISEMKWYDPKQLPFQVNGFAWFEMEEKYRRLPNRPKEPISEQVDHLADCTSGGQIRFQTNSTKLAIRVKLKDKANLNHMSALSQCGFDCYIGKPGKQQFYNGTLYDHSQNFYEILLFERENNCIVNITLNFPLYQGVKQVQIGLDQSAQVISPLKHNRLHKIIFYGTSITQGGCASRPGLSYTNIISRRLNQECINLGFSGNGKGEESMAKIIRSIKNPECLVLDYEPNCVSTELYMKTLPKFIEVYRESHPNIPILLLSKFPYAGEQMNTSLLHDRLERLSFQKELVKKLQKEGDHRLYFHEGTNLLGKYFRECTIDGIHPNDLGFMSIANELTLVLKNILNH